MQSQNKLKANVKKELEKWDDRIYFTNVVEFRKDSDLRQLKQIYNKSLEKFVIISLSKEITVYKTMRYFIQECNLVNSQITFLDGRQLDSFLVEETEYWRIKRNIDEFIEFNGDQFNNKFVVIPHIEAKFNSNSAIYLMNKLKSTKAIGLVFYTPEDSVGTDLSSVLSLNRLFLDNFLEFPTKRRRISIPKLEDDGL